MNRPFGQCRQAVRHPRPFFSHRVAVTGYQTSCVRYRHARVQATLILLSQKLEPHSTFFDLFDVTCAVRPGLLRDAHLGRAGTGMTVAPRARAAGACWPRAAGPGPGERLRVSIPLTLSLMSSMSSRSAGSFSVLSTKSSPEPVAVTFRFGRRGRRRGVRRRNGNSTQKREKEID